MTAGRADVLAVVARVRAVYGRWRRDTPVAQMRADWDALFAAPGDAQVEDTVVQGVPCRWHTSPGADPDRVVVYFHGGGFQVGSLDSHRELMAGVSAAAGARVLGVAYRLAPEHRHPAALTDARAVLAGLAAQGVAPCNTALAGDSAGGGLALAVLLALQANSLGQPAACWCMSAWTDLTASGSSYDSRSTQDPIHQRPMVTAMARQVLDGADGRDPLASPLFASDAQLRGLPPLLLQVGDCETVLSDSEDFARKAQAAGAQVLLQVWPDMIHVFQQFPAELPEAPSALAAGGQFLRTQFAAAASRKHLS